MPFLEGCKIRLRTLVYDPPRNGPTLWEIGIPDRTAAEFYVPDPNPTLMNQLYTVQPDKLVHELHHLFLFFCFLCLIDHSYVCLKLDRFRQYGLWDRYSDLYPDRDLVYAVESSIYQTDWYFAHVNRYITTSTLI